ncbi:MAG: SUMF1/EgtB/PvdO family nonheme iron enzyme [Planctomycetota bacterium]
MVRKNQTQCARTALRGRNHAGFGGRRQYLAARGTAGRKYPWGNEPRQLGNAYHVAVKIGERADMFEIYRQRAAAVNSHADARTPEGLFHVFGNVGEWCESLFVARMKGEWIPATGERLVVGGWWCAASYGDGDDLSHFSKAAAHSSELFFYNGFRCARSEVSH